jgi:hypothetical protein
VGIRCIIPGLELAMRPDDSIENRPSIDPQAIRLHDLRIMRINYDYHARYPDEYGCITNGDMTMASYQEILSQIEELKHKAQEARKQEMCRRPGGNQAADVRIRHHRRGDITGKAGKAKSKRVARRRNTAIPPAARPGPAVVAAPPGLVELELESQGKSLDSCKI